MQKLKPIRITKKFKEDKWKTQVKALNEMCKVKLNPSPIHGIGVFAMRDINKGEKLDVDAVPHAFDLPYKYFVSTKKDRVRGDVAEHVLGQYPLIQSGSHFYFPTLCYLTYMNHSDSANYDAKNNVVLKNIKQGEEVLEDYKQIEGWQKIFNFIK